MQVARRRRVLSWTPPLVLAMALVVLAAGCAPPSPPPGGGGGALAGHVFLSTSVTEDGQPRPLVPGTRVQLGFSPRGDRFDASAGCNSVGGPVQVSGNRLVMEVEWTTDQACDPARTEQDAWLSGFLSGDPTFRVQGQRLRLQLGGTVVDLIDQEAETVDRPLVGTQWQLESIVGHLVVRPLPPGTAATVSFSDRSVSFQVKDCNVGSGDAVIGPRTIQVGALRMTARACAPAPSEVEAAVTGVLNGTIVYGIEGDVLTLTHPSWRGLILRAAPEPPSPPPLEGTQWHLESLIDEGQGRPLPPGTGATMSVVPPNMQVQIKDCNGGSANVVVSRAALEIGPFRWTRMACQAGPAELEAFVLDVLRGETVPGYANGVVGYEFDASGRLVLRRGDTNDGLVFSATPPRPETPLVTYHVTGGFIGVDESLVVHSDGRAVYSGSVEERTLSPEQLTELVEALVAADFPTLPPDTIDPNVADAFIYEVTYDGYRVVTSDGSLTPPQLEPALAELREVVALFR